MLQSQVNVRYKMTKQICRVCLQEGGSFVELDNGKNSYKHKLKTCVPELNINILHNPMLCESCLDMLEIAFKLKEKCLRSQLILTKAILCGSFLPQMNDNYTGNASKNLMNIKERKKRECYECLLINSHELNTRPETAVDVAILCENCGVMFNDEEFFELHNKVYKQYLEPIVIYDAESCSNTSDDASNPVQNRSKIDVLSIKREHNYACSEDALYQDISCREDFATMNRCKTCERYFETESLLCDHVIIGHPPDDAIGVVKRTELTDRSKEPNFKGKIETTDSELSNTKNDKYRSQSLEMSLIKKEKEPRNITLMDISIKEEPDFFYTEHTSNEDNSVDYYSNTNNAMHQCDVNKDVLRDETIANRNMERPVNVNDDTKIVSADIKLETFESYDALTCTDKKMLESHNYIHNESSETVKCIICNKLCLKIAIASHNNLHHSVQDAERDCAINEDASVNTGKYSSNKNDKSREQPLDVSVIKKEKESENISQMDIPIKEEQDFFYTENTLNADNSVEYYSNVSNTMFQFNVRENILEEENITNGDTENDTTIGKVVCNDFFDKSIINNHTETRSIFQLTADVTENTNIVRESLNFRTFGYDDTLTCKTCNDTFTDKKLFESHNEMHNETVLHNTLQDIELDSDNEEAFMRTGRCNSDNLQSSFKNVQENNSENSCQKETNFTCCNKTFSNLYLLHLHTTKEHGYICYVCNLKLPNKQALGGHFRRHKHERSNKCKDCGKLFTQRANLLRHVHAVHSLVMPYKCDKCGERFRRNKYLEEHMRTHSQKYACDECNGVFRELKVLRRHKRSHMPQPHKCEVCHSFFARKSSLVRHKKDIHKVSTIKKRSYGLGNVILGSSEEN